MKLCEKEIYGPFGKWAGSKKFILYTIINYFAIGFLDGLWDDYQTHRFSLPDKWSPESNRFSYELCEKFPGKYPIIDMTFQRQGSSEAYRGKQKVKIMSVTACLV